MVVTGALLAGATPVLAVERPAVGDAVVSRAGARVSALEAGRIKARLAQADAELVRYGSEAQWAMERHNGQRVLLARARTAAKAARVRAKKAEGAYRQARDAYSAYAPGAYTTTTSSTTRLAMLFTGGGGARGMLDRAGMLQVMATQQEGLLKRMKAARKVSRLLRSEAKKAYKRQKETAALVARTRRDAIAAVEAQKDAAARIGATRKDLVRRLDKVRPRAERLAERRTEELRARTERRLDLEAVRRLEDDELSPRGAGRGKTVVREALKWIGTPYSWGGGNTKGPSKGIAHGAKIRGFDCSGLALYAWAKAGIGLDHWTGSQWAAGPKVPTTMLRAGDLVFFAKNTKDPDTIHHVGIFIGDGRMVEAPYTGARVRISSIWRNGLIGAVRPG
ncbi:NlpC/P60 family protein [Actinocorallia sp. A-T 12471]|uniref:NlpC/P60 family protein n=1 Tax=Actinocorallia sp. A-T 12471 TaxID=3089813 RepID=UPI0029CFF306|nr:NlpC/P60 family protein [Actinocorallia sp. A-T 12471]MDX6741832.1 NlpC/P60 family protein [Actinocorallia sp. A-T 12471]